MIKTKFKDNIYLKDGSLMEKGTEAIVFFTEDDHIARIEIPSINKAFKTRIRNLQHTFLGFPKMPSIKTLKRWESKGYCKTITGKKVELDGRGHDNSPSWLLVIGVI